jgi:PhzF family phenazine biosynthesis protein
MNALPIYQVDAFSREPFKGNPAAVCLLPASLEDVLLQAIAAEMNLSETAFVMRLDEGPWTEQSVFSLRWFTPQVEVRLCGHATLATAAVLFDVVAVEAPQVTFRTLGGDLVAGRARRGAPGVQGLTLDFPLNSPVACEPPADVLDALGLERVEDAVHGAHTRDLLLRLSSAEAVRAVCPDVPRLLDAAGMAPYRGLMITAAGEGPYDVVSRFFAPWVGIDEDPVTGSAHTLLAPYWAARLDKEELLAYQASARGGEVGMRLVGQERVELIGNAVVVLQGTLKL